MRRSARSDHIPMANVQPDEPLDRFRSRFRRWLDDALPGEWRKRSLGPTDEELIGIRREFGHRMGVAGWLSATWPVEYGGLGLSAHHRLALVEEMVAVDAPEPMNVNSLNILAPTMFQFGTPEQCELYLPPMVRHDAIWCQGFSEPGAGSDLASISTRAERCGDELVITGQKLWISYAHIADWCYMLVRTGDGGDKHDGLSLVAVPLHSAGITISAVKNIVGTDEFCEVFLDGARIPATNVIGKLDDGWRIAMFALSQERVLGLAQRSFRLMAEFATLVELYEAERRRGNPKMSFDFFAQEVVDAYARSCAVGATVQRAFEIEASGGPLGALPSVAKVAWSEAHQQQLSVAIDLFDLESSLCGEVGERWWKAMLWARAETIYAGTSQIQRNVIGRALNLPKV